MDQLTQQKNKWATLIGCSLSCFLGTLDFGIVNTAIPAIQQELGASLIQLQWVMGAYTLAFIMMVVMSGRLADLYGRKRVNLCGVVAFGSASLFAGFASSPHSLILWRLIQGLAISAVIPSALALITRAFPANEKGKAIGIWTSITSFGMVIGPVLSGFLVSAFSWRWVFFINIPFVLISLGLTLFLTQESRNRAVKQTIDLQGMLLLAAGLFFLISAFINAPNWGWTSLHSLSYFGIASLFLILFYFSEVRSKSPTIEFHLFANRTFFSCTLILFCTLFVLAEVFFLAPLYLQTICHQAPYMAGLMLLPMAGSIILFSPLVGHWMNRFSAKKLMLIGLAISFVGGLLQSRIRADSSPLFIMGSLLLLGIGYAFARSPSTATGLNALPSQVAGTASGAIWTIQNIGNVMGITIAITLFRQAYEPAQTPEGFLLGYKYAMVVMCALLLLTGLIVLFLMKDKPIVADEVYNGPTN